MNTEEFLHWMNTYAETLQAEKELLTELDSAIGDGDHGTNMARGFSAVQEKLKTGQPEDIGSAAKLISSTLISTVGGASGPLYGTFFLKMAIQLAKKQNCTAQELAESMEKGCSGIQALGKAQKDDKTMLDTLIPAIAAFKTAAAEQDISACFAAAEKAAKAGMEATIPLVAKKGRDIVLNLRKEQRLLPVPWQTVRYR